MKDIFTTRKCSFYPSAGILIDGNATIIIPEVAFYASPFAEGAVYTIPNETEYAGCRYINTRKTKADQMTIDFPFLLRSHTGEAIEEPNLVALDIETEGLEAKDKVLGVGIGTPKHNTIAFGKEEDTLLLSMLITQMEQPTLIVGHNIYDFDLPHLKKRYQYVVNFSEEELPDFPFVSFSDRIRIGMEQKEVTGWFLFGAHTAQVVDTYPLTQRFDIMQGGKAPSFNLKALVSAYGLTDRERHEKFHQVAEEQQVAYLFYDLEDTLLLFNHITEYFRALQEIIPIGWCLHDGFGTILNKMFTFYVGWFRPIPYRKQQEETYQGAFVDVAAGRYENVTSLDVVSLYPNIMRRYIQPYWDNNGVFQKIVEALLQKRLEAKANGQEALQKALKIVINSIYGFLAVGTNFSDIDKAKEVTRIGRETIMTMKKIVEDTGGVVCELDTDGIYFVHENPEKVKQTIEEVTGFQTEMNRYNRGLFVKKKNYALVKPDGSVVMKGNSLRSRRDNAIYSRLVRDIVDALLSDEPEKRIADLWEKCFHEYSFYDLKTLPKEWFLGDREVEKAKLLPLEQRLSNLEKLKAVFLRFDTFPVITSFFQDQRRPTWRKRIAQEQGAAQV